MVSGRLGQHTKVETLMPFNFSYQNSVSFDLKTAFERQPSALMACPMCTAALTHSEIAPSALGLEHLSSSLTPMLDPTRLFVCPNCRWWAIRETGWYVDIRSVFDYLITGTILNFDCAFKRPLIEMLRAEISGGAGTETTNLEQIIGEALQRWGHPSEVHRIGERTDVDKPRTDIYLIDDDEAVWLVDVSCPDQEIQFDPVRTLNGCLVGDDVIHGLVMSCEPGPAERARGPFVAKVVDPARVRRLIEKIPGTHTPPWSKAIDEVSCWAPLHSMSKEFASLLFPEAVAKGAT